MGIGFSGLALLVGVGLVGGLALLGRSPGRRRHLRAGALILLASLPLGLVLALVLLPLWRWIERATGIEAVGHSGPAEWCYVLSALACAAFLGAVHAWRVLRSGRPPRHEPGEPV